IYFNSGASEGISHIIGSVLLNSPSEKKVVITSPIEHVVVPTTLKFYEERFGFKIIEVGITKDGVIKLEHLESLLNEHKDKTALVSIMAANNETGVIQPYQEIAQLSHEYGVDYFCDTTQIIGKGEFNFEESGIDYGVCSGHKIGALSGSGFILVKDATKLTPHVFGSSQEHGIRGGTQNYLGIETLAIAIREFTQNKNKLVELQSARESFETQLKKEIPFVVIIGEEASRLAGTTLVGFPGIHGQAILIELEAHNIFVTTSAACSDNQPETSVVLKSMGIEDNVGRSVVRISLSYHNQAKDYAYLAEKLISIYNKLNRIHSY
ncbi:MAG TPA: aminotransferase class V-fold PLP-dependent enzyme, partial [Bacteriovoracaceae bacterium]|nr:aminotransferase class V-fold PLP-dependent enzyme [Bacteriovoracaceae bacterium]